MHVRIETEEERRSNQRWSEGLCRNSRWSFAAVPVFLVLAALSGSFVSGGLAAIFMLLAFAGVFVGFWTTIGVLLFNRD